MVMNITPIIFFFMAAAILILVLILIVIVFYLLKTRIPHINSGRKDDVFQKNADLLSETRIKALKIIDDANNQALDIVNKVTLSTDSASENFKSEISHASSAQIKEFEKVTSDFITLYSKILQDLKIKNIELFQNISKDIEVNTSEEIKNFKETIQKSTSLFQNEVKKKVDADYEISKKEIESYKKAELAKIDSEIYLFLEKVAKIVFGKTISLSEHEDLIEESLEKAKKEGVFK